MTSFLSWSAGKTKQLPEISKHMPTRIRNLYDPCVGGGSVLLHALHKAEQGEIELSGKVLAADTNLGLILTYRAVQQNPDYVIAVYEDLCNAHENCLGAKQCSASRRMCLCKSCVYMANRLLYNTLLDQAREEPDREEPHTLLAALFLYINATCYRGLWRESKSGMCNSCFGATRPILLKSDDIRAAADLLRKYEVEFRCEDVNVLLSGLEGTMESDDFVFLDPPYVDDKDAEGEDQQAFGLDEMQALLGWLDEHSGTCTITFCNAAVPELRETFEGSWPVVRTYHERRNLKNRSEVEISAELLVSNVPPPTPPPSP